MYLRRLADLGFGALACRFRGNERPTQVTHSPFLAACLGVILFFLSPSCLIADLAPHFNGKPIVGWDGNYVLGRWTEVRVPVSIRNPTDCQLELTAIDADGNRVGFVSESQLEPGADVLTGWIKVGRLNGELKIQLNTSFCHG